MLIQNGICFLNVMCFPFGGSQEERKMGRTSTKNGKTSSPKNSMGISTNGKKKPRKAKNAVDY
jgi:hypothetical protein